MKTEDIDKKIGMPDVDAEWAKFEHEVIDKETASHKRVMLWGLSIAASIALVAGIFLYGHDVEEQAETLVAVAEKSATPATHEAPATEPETESVSETEKAPDAEKAHNAEKATNTEKAPKAEQRPDAGLLAMATPSETKKEEVLNTNPATENPTKVFNFSVEEQPRFPGNLLAFIRENKRYDGLAQEYGVKGRVATSFLIDSLGYISEIKVHKCLLKFDTLRLNRESPEMQEQVKQQITKQLGDESMRIVRLMPRWTPGKMNGKPRNTRYVIRVDFP